MWYRLLRNFWEKTDVRTDFALECRGASRETCRADADGAFGGMQLMPNELDTNRLLTSGMLGKRGVPIV